MSASLRERFERILPSVARPARYTGGEWNQTIKEPALVRVALAYPDLYEIGMSNLGLRILYEIINEDDRFAAERVFSPWTDMRERMAESDLPLMSLETGTAIKDFDVFGITLQSELTFSNVLGLLDMARIPRRSRDRTGAEPLVIGGGPCAYNPEPLSPFFDLFVIGEAETAIIELLATIAISKAEDEPGSDPDQGRRRLMSRLADMDGVYVPAMVSPESGYPLVDRAGRPLSIKKRTEHNFDKLASVRKPIVPFLETIHDRCVVEVMRGCSRGCRFCQAGIIYRPVRERTAHTVRDAARAQAENTGYDDISLASLSTTDHSQIRPMLDELAKLPENYVRSISLPSMRTDAFSVGIAEAIAGRKKTGLTFAPEAGTARMRAIINKGLSEETVLEAAGSAFKAGWRRLKFYFMIGLPGERDEDIIGIADLIERVQGEAVRVLGVKPAKQIRIVVSASTFVPKSHTPFQWAGALTLDEVERKQKLLKQHLPGRVDFKWHEAGSSLLEAALSRGDRAVAEAIEHAYDRGACFDGWSDHFNLDIWRESFREAGLDLEKAASAKWDLEQALPWSHIDCGIEPGWLIDEYQKAIEGVQTPDCRVAECSDCGVCGNGVEPELAGH